MACLMPVTVPVMAVAGPCDELAKKAENTGGFWPYVKVLPPVSVAVDGPWAAKEEREATGAKSSGFQPHDQKDRARLLAEAKSKDPGNWGIADAWLSPSSAAFDAAMQPFEEASEAGKATLQVHRWAGVNVFAVSIHNPGWYDCQATMALFYRDPAGVLHYASADGLNDCDVHGGIAYAKPVLVDGQFAFVDEMRVDDAISGDIDMWQDIQLWQGDTLAPVCHLNYYHDIGYAVSDQTRYEDANGRDRPPNALDDWLKQNYPSLMTAYVAAYTRDRGLVALPYDQWKATHVVNQAETLHGFAAGNMGLDLNLKLAYDALVRKKRFDFSATVVPVFVQQTPYLVSIKQEYSGKGPAMPYIDVDMYAVNGEASDLVANLTLDHVLDKLRSVRVGKQKE
jgi:hypothetical protein